MKRALLIALVSSPLWILAAIGLIFDTADFIGGFLLAAVIVGSILATTYLVMDGGSK